MPRIVIELEKATKGEAQAALKLLRHLAGEAEAAAPAEAEAEAPAPKPKAKPKEPTAGSAAALLGSQPSQPTRGEVVALANQVLEEGGLRMLQPVLDRFELDGMDKLEPEQHAAVAEALQAALAGS